MQNAFNKRNNLIGPKVVEQLKNRQFEAYYIENPKDVITKIVELIPKNHTIGWGGSFTLTQLKIQEQLKNQGFKLIDRDSATSQEERTKLMKDILTCGTFLTGTNAITENGELFNIDRVGNRVAPICFGPESVIVVCGANKIVKDLSEAYNKVRHYTAPINAQRFCDSTPCSKTGECFDCISEQTICASFVATRFSSVKNRIKVIIVGENLGI